MNPGIRKLWKMGRCFHGVMKHKVGTLRLLEYEEVPGVHVAPQGTRQKMEKDLGSDFIVNKSIENVSLQAPN